MVIPKAMVNMTRPCKTTSTALKSQSTSPKLKLVIAVFGEEIDKKTAGKDNIAPKPATAIIVVVFVFVSGLSLSISPERNKIAKVPMPTANWKIATKGASAKAYNNAVKKKVVVKAATEYIASSRKIAKHAETKRPTLTISRTPGTILSTRAILFCFRFHDQ